MVWGGTIVFYGTKIVQSEWFDASKYSTKEEKTKAFENFTEENSITNLLNCVVKDIESIKGKEEPIYETDEGVSYDDFGINGSEGSYLYFWQAWADDVLALDPDTMLNIEKDSRLYMDTYKKMCVVLGMEIEEPRWCSTWYASVDHTQ